MQRLKVILVTYLAGAYAGSVIYNDQLPWAPKSDCPPTVPDGSEPSWCKFYAEDSDLFEGDIVLHPGQDGKNGITDPKFHWPNGVMHYTIDSTFSTADKDVILKAIDEFNTRTSCVRIKERTSQRNYVFIRNNPQEGCNSAVGMVGEGQNLNLGRGCISHGIIVHELMHALGFWHQQSAADRDDWVKIECQNICPGLEFAFNKQTTSIDFGIGYEYGSIMHYPKDAFSKNNLSTIIPTKDPSAILGQLKGLSNKDILKLQAMYKCN